MSATDASGSVPHPQLPSAAADPTVARAKRPAAAPNKLRSVFAIDERPAWIAFAATPVGRASLFAVFFLLLLVSMPLRASVIVLAGAAAAAFVVQHRDRAVLAATLAALVFDPLWYSDASFEAYVDAAAAGSVWSPRNVQRFLTAAMFVLTALALRRVAKKPDWFFAKRPAVTLLALIGVATALCLILEQGVVSLWLVLSIKVLAVYMWFICYAVVDQRSPKRSSLMFSLGLIRPFWGSSSTPIGKGTGYLAKLRCEGREELAALQLKALKLLAWSVVLQCISLLLVAVATRASLPSLEVLVADYAKGTAAPIGIGWIALILAVAVGTIDLAVWGHRVVACARLAGWKLRRNTWRPLESRSLADFWNRYYYYFKELLLDFFFYPTFFRYFKKRPKLRTFCATFMAAGVGNAIYHFVRDIDRVFSLGPGLAIAGYGSYVFYCVALASGIAISQVRTGSGPSAASRAAESSGFSTRLKAFVSVWGFVVILHVFGFVEDRTISFSDRVSFLVHQFGF
jgi:hypothetical protein